MTTKFFQTSIIAICGVLIFGSANAAMGSEWNLSKMDDLKKEIPETVKEHMEEGCKEMKIDGIDIPNCATDKELVTGVNNLWTQYVENTPEYCEKIQFINMKNYSLDAYLGLSDTCSATRKVNQERCNKISTQEKADKQRCDAFVFMTFYNCFSYFSALKDACDFIEFKYSSTKK